MGNPRILIVEDQASAAHDLHASLQRLGYRVSGVAPSGDEALLRAEECRPDVALVDIHLQGRLDGRQAADALRDRLRIPVVYLSARESGTEGGIPAAATPECIPAPFHEKELRGAIESAIHRHAMETKLEESREWFFTTLRSIADAVVATDEKGRVTFLNPQAEAITGWSQGEACGRTLGEVLQLEKRKREDGEDPDSDSDFQSGRRPVSDASDAEVVARDGERTPVEAKAALIREKDGRVIGVVRILRDITDRKRSEEVLRRSERRYRNLVEKSQDIIFTLSREGIITTLNPAFEKSTGWACRDWLYRPFADLLNRADRSAAWDSLGKVLRGEYFPPRELRLRDKTGGEVVVECGCAPAMQDGRPGGVWGIARDITHRKRLEQRVLQTQKLDAVGRLAGGIAHDFNNLLTSINGHADFLSLALDKEGPLAKHVSGILGAVDRATTLTRQLLAFNRQQVVAPRALGMNGVIARILPGLTGLVDENIELVLDLDPSLGPIFADANQMEQVILILIANAREAMPKGGRLTLTTGEVREEDKRIAAIPPVTALGHVALSISDTGRGMTDEIKARLFEPFFTTKPIGKGAGLGLSTVYGIVKLGGGDLQVESTPGLGTVFRLFFPRIEAIPTVPVAGTAATESKDGSETVLLVEDEEDVRFLLSSILKTNGYTVLEAKDGLQALEMAASHPGTIDLVLTDLHMPKLGGRGLLEKLLAVNRGIKAIFMSGFGREDFPDAHAQGLPVAFLEKPFMPKSLIRQIRKVLDA